MGLELEQDQKRKPVALNLLAARKRQSKQTGFVHHCYESCSENEHDTIPILENSCFVLALFRSKIADNVLEGRTLLEKILAFEVNGNFPIYLHEYPLCKNHCLSLDILPVLHWIFRDFQSVLGEELKLKLEHTLKRIDEYGSNCSEQQMLSKSAASKLLAYRKDKKSLDWEPSSPYEWSQFLISLQMLGPFFENHTENVHRAVRFWHQKILTYVGPNKQQFQEKHQPAITLYDLFMGYFFRSYSQRALQDHPIHLQAALIGSTQQPLTFHTSHHPTFGLNLDPVGMIPFTLAWGNEEHVHTMVCPIRKNKMILNASDHEVEMLFVLPEIVPEDNSDQFEICFYCNIHDDNHILLQATTFQLEDKITIASQGLQIGITFSKEHGEGTFFGHISRSNRPMQKSCIGENVHEAYDWRIALRTVRREPRCAIKALIRLALGS